MRPGPKAVEGGVGVENGEAEVKVETWGRDLGWGGGGFGREKTGFLTGPKGVEKGWGGVLKIKGDQCSQPKDQLWTASESVFFKPGASSQATIVGLTRGKHLW